MKNCAVLMPGYVGDFVLALSVVIRKAKSSTDALTLIVPQNLIPLCTLLTNLPYFPYRRGTRGELMETISGVRRQKFDMLYLLSGSFSAAWFGIRSGISNRRAIRGDLLTTFIAPSTVHAGGEHVAHLTHDYAEVLEVPHEDPELWQGVSIRPHSDISSQFVALCPGVGHDVSGKWQGFREVVKLLPNYEFVVLGDENDVAAAKSIASHLPHRVRNHAGKTTIEAAAAILASASVVISNHCGLMQLAGFLGAPVVGIFGPGSPERNRPLGQSVRCAVPDVICHNCKVRSCVRGNHRCLGSITPEAVLALAGEIVRQVPQ